MDSKDKQNKKFPCVNTSRFIRPTNQACFFSDNENIFNSTAKNPTDLMSNEADISSISAFSSFFPSSDFKSGFGYEMGKPSASHSNDIIANSNDVNIRQIELDCLYTQYLTILTMKENLKKSFKDEEENFVKEMFELYKCNETLKKTCTELEYEENILNSLTEIVEFMDTTIEWVDSNSSQLKNFEGNFTKLADLCSKANKFLKIKNIHMPENLDFEESVAVELRQTIYLLEQINNFNDDKCLTPAPNVQVDDNFNYKLIKDLKNQYEKLKMCLLKYNTLRMMENTSNS